MSVRSRPVYPYVTQATTWVSDESHYHKTRYAFQSNALIGLEGALYSKRVSVVFRLQNICKTITVRHMIPTILSSLKNSFPYTAQGVNASLAVDDMFTAALSSLPSFRGEKAYLFSYVERL